MSLHKFILSSLETHFTRDLVADLSLHLDFGDCTVEVRSNSAPLVELLQAYFGIFVVAKRSVDILVTAMETAEREVPYQLVTKEPDPGKTKIKEEYADVPGGRIVRKRLTGMVFLFGQGRNLAVGPCVANANQIVNFINNRYIEYKINRGCMLGHSAAVASSSGQTLRGLALAGFSGAGKSTLALHLLSRGALFVSNDRLLVQGGYYGLVMSGVAKLPRINPGTALNNPDLSGVIPDEERKELEEMPLDALWDLEQKYDVYLDQCFGEGRFILSAPMNGLVILNWRREPIPTLIEKVDPWKRPDLLPAFMKSTGLFYVPENGRPHAEPSLEQYQKLLSGCGLYEITGGVDFDVAADFCLTLLQGRRQ